MSNHLFIALKSGKIENVTLLFRTEGFILKNNLIRPHTKSILNASFLLLAEEFRDVDLVFQLDESALFIVELTPAGIRYYWKHNLINEFLFEFDRMGNCTSTRRKTIIVIAKRTGMLIKRRRIKYSITI